MCDSQQEATVSVLQLQEYNRLCSESRIGQIVIRRALLTLAPILYAKLNLTPCFHNHLCNVKELHKNRGLIQRITLKKTWTFPPISCNSLRVPRMQGKILMILKTGGQV